MSDVNVKKWYVVKAVSGQEKKVKELIQSEIIHNKLEEYVAQVLIPTEKVYQIRNGKKIQKEKSYLPGYILIEAVLVGEVPHVIKNINGVVVKITYFDHLGTSSEVEINNYDIVPDNGSLTLSENYFKNIHADRT